MSASVSATELAKLGKCEKLIRVVSGGQPQPKTQKARRKPSGNADTLRGEKAHLRYENAAKRHMSDSEGAKRRSYQIIFSAVVAGGILSLLVAAGFGQ